MNFQFIKRWLIYCLLLSLSGCTPDLGKLYLPSVKAPPTRESLRLALKEIKIEPSTSLLLDDRDRKDFLNFVMQICAASQVYTIGDLHVESDAPVWNILKANFPKGRELLIDPNVTSKGFVNTASLANELIVLMMEQK